MRAVTPLRLAIATWLVVFACAGTLAAQEFRATVTGTRHRSRPASPMPGVTVTALNTQTNEIATAVTSSEGVYSLPFLKPGLYTVTAELQGFRKYDAGQGAARGRPDARPSTSSCSVGAVTEVGDGRQRSRRVVEGRSRHGHRQHARHRAAAQRAQSVHAVVPRRRASPTTGRRSISARSTTAPSPTGRSTAARTATTSSCSTARPTTPSRAATTSPTCRRSTRCRSSRSSPTATTRSTAGPPAASSTSR